MSKFDQIRERMKKFTSERRGGKGFVAKSPDRKDKQTTKTDKDDKDSKPSNQKKAEDKAKLNVGLGTSNQKKAEDKADVNVGVANRTTQNFIDDLKDAYKTGLFTGGNKTKEFMNKYNLDSQDIVKLRTGIDQGLGTIMGGKGNVLSNVVGELRAEGGIKDFFESPDFLQQRSSEIFEPGMTKYDREPMTGLMGLSPVANIGLKGLDLIAGGSSQGLRGLVYGRDVLGLTGEDLDNFAASVANDSNLYNQIMATPRMQEYQLNEFRAEANKQAMAKRQGQGDPNPISGTQPGEEAKYRRWNKILQR